MEEKVMTDKHKIDTDDPRVARARRSASMVMHLLIDFLPSDNATRDRIYRTIIDAFYDSNAAIVNVPPEWDRMNEMQIVQAMMETHPIFVSSRSEE